MPVHFVYRSHEVGHTQKHVRHFDDDTVLAWFQRIWQPHADVSVAHRYAYELFGCNVHAFYGLFMHIAERGLPVPTTVTAAVEALLNSSHCQRLNHQAHAVCALTDDGELELAYYLWDDHFDRAPRGVLEYLLWEDWQLPDHADAGEFIPESRLSQIGEAFYCTGTLYLVFLTYYDAHNLSALTGAYRINGLRLNDLCCYLNEHGSAQVWPDELITLWTYLWGSQRQTFSGMDEAFLQVIRAERYEQAHWGVYADWRAEQDLAPPGLFLLDQALRRVEPPGFEEQHDRTRDLVHVSAHLAQASLHTGDNRFHQWILFDDCWAGANPALAHGILRFATRWDVLAEE